MKIVLSLLILILNGIYLPFKLLPTQHKITFISRQSDKVPLNYILLNNELRNTKNIFLVKTLDKSISSKVKYFFHMFRQMYHIATSKIVILDSFCICASVLNHKKNLKIIQMWHAMGSIKKFGYSTLNKKEGTKRQFAKNMKMHYNYDYIFASSDFAANNFKEALNTKRVKKFAMPIVDLIQNADFINSSIDKIRKEYPNLNKKINILFAPTFRKSEEHEYKNLFLDEIDYKKYNVIMKSHELSNYDLSNKKVLHDKKFTSQEWMCFVDYVVTDYSALMIEALIMKKKLYLYTPDLNDYIENRGFYFEFKNILDGVYFESASVLIRKIEAGNYNYNKLNNFKKLMLDVKLNDVSHKIANFIKRLM